MAASTCTQKLHQFLNLSTSHGIPLRLVNFFHTLALALTRLKIIDKSNRRQSEMTTLHVASCHFRLLSFTMAPMRPPSLRWHRCARFWWLPLDNLGNWIGAQAKGGLEWGVSGLAGGKSARPPPLLLGLFLRVWMDIYRSREKKIGFLIFISFILVLFIYLFDPISTGNWCHAIRGVTEPTEH